MANVFSHKIKVKCPRSPWMIYDDIIVRGTTNEAGDFFFIATCDWEHSGEDICMKCRAKILDFCNEGNDTKGIIYPNFQNDQ